MNTGDWIAFAGVMGLLFGYLSGLVHWGWLDRKKRQEAAERAWDECARRSPDEGGYMARLRNNPYRTADSWQVAYVPVPSKDLGGDA